VGAAYLSGLTLSSDYDGNSFYELKSHLKECGRFMDFGYLLGVRIPEHTA